MTQNVNTPAGTTKQADNGGNTGGSGGEVGTNTSNADLNAAGNANGNVMTTNVRGAGSGLLPVTSTIGVSSLGGRVTDEARNFSGSRTPTGRGPGQGTANAGGAVSSGALYNAFGGNGSAAGGGVATANVKATTFVDQVVAGLNLSTMGGVPYLWNNPAGRLTILNLTGEQNPVVPAIKLGSKVKEFELVIAKSNYSVGLADPSATEVAPLVDASAAPANAVLSIQLQGSNAVANPNSLTYPLIGGGGAVSIAGVSESVSTYEKTDTGHVALTDGVTNVIRLDALNLINVKDVSAKEVGIITLTQLVGTPGTSSLKTNKAERITRDNQTTSNALIIEPLDISAAVINQLINTSASTTGVSTITTSGAVITSYQGGAPGSAPQGTALALGLTGDAVGDSTRYAPASTSTGVAGTVVGVDKRGSGAGASTAGTIGVPVAF